MCRRHSEQVGVRSSIVEEVVLKAAAVVAVVVVVSEWPEPEVWVAEPDPPGSDSWRVGPPSPGTGGQHVLDLIPPGGPG